MWFWFVWGLVGFFCLFAGLVWFVLQFFSSVMTFFCEQLHRARRRRGKYLLLEKPAAPHQEIPIGGCVCRSLYITFFPVFLRRYRTKKTERLPLLQLWKNTAHSLLKNKKVGLWIFSGGCFLHVVLSYMKTELDLEVLFPIFHFIVLEHTICSWSLNCLRSF